MKTIIITLVLSLFFVFSSCKNDSTDNQTDTTNTEIVDTNSINPQDVSLGKEYTSHFICPNHCAESGSEEAGICPICGMEYIENFDYKN